MELIDKIKQEENKLLEIVQEFNNTEQRLIFIYVYVHISILFLKIDERKEWSTSRSYKNKNILFGI